MRKPGEPQSPAGEGGVTNQEATRSKMLALAKDVETVEQVMEQVEALEQELESQFDPLSTKAIELKNSLKKTLTNGVFEQALDNLEIQGSPVWGLSTAEREMIMSAREKRNEC
jgi:hypothetical protein